MAAGGREGDAPAEVPVLPTADEELARAQANPVIPIPDLSDDHKKRYYGSGSV